MKKTIYSTLGILAAFMLASCTQEEMEVKSSFLNENGQKLTLSGSAYNGTDATKVSIGEKDGSTYPLLWTEGDVIGIYSRSTVTTPGVSDATGNDTTYVAGNIVGEAAELYSGSDGDASGVFQTTNSFTVDADEDIVIVYPYETLSYTDGVISMSLPELQTQRAANNSESIGAYTLGYDITTLKADQIEDVEFALEQKTAFVQVNVATSEFSSYYLTGAKLYAEGATLSGDITCDISTGELSITNASESAGVTLRTPVQMSGTQTLYFTAYPADLSTASSIYLQISLQDADGVETLTIPVEMSSVTLKESCLTVLTLTDLSSSSCTLDWYDIHETRALCDGWAYGPQNTYNVLAGNEVVIDVKARGDIAKVKKPAKYGLIISGCPATRNFIYTENQTGKVASLADMTFPESVSAEYTITVKTRNNSGTPTAVNWGTVGITDADGNILWSYMICGYIENDEPTYVTYPSGTKMADRVLGAGWSHSLGATLATPDIDNNSAYFQWGRKDPIPWSNGSSAFTVATATETTSLEDVISNPNVVYFYATGTDGDWQGVEHRTDLWGGVNETDNWYDPNNVGYKTIYDPCPEGWRVPDPTIFYEVESGCSIWEIDLGSSYASLQSSEWINTNSIFYSKDAVLAYPLSSTEYDYWPYDGCLYGSVNSNWPSRAGSNSKNGAVYWSNGVYNNGQQGVSMEYLYGSTWAYHNERNSSNRAQMFPIRCQVDDENR